MNSYKTTPEVAKIIGVKRVTLWHWVKMGYIPSPLSEIRYGHPVLLWSENDRSRAEEYKKAGFNKPSWPHAIAARAKRASDLTLLRERISLYVSEEPNSGCWLWAGSTNKAGYGVIRVTPHTGLVEYTRTVLAYRLLWELENGNVPQGLELDHLCRVRCCVNPVHLEPVTHEENILRGNWGPTLNKAKTHCPNGHPYNDQNTYINSHGGRVCKMCWWKLRGKLSRGR